MKTVKKGAGETQEIRRVKDNVANTMVKGGEWKYCPKSEWKKTQAPKPQPKPVKEDKAQVVELKRKAEKGKRAYMEAKADKQGK